VRTAWTEDSDGDGPSTRAVDSSKLLREFRQVQEDERRLQNAEPPSGIRDIAPSQPPSSRRAGLRPLRRPASRSSEITPVEGKAYRFPPEIGDATSDDGVTRMWPSRGPDVTLGEVSLTDEEVAAIEADGFENTGASASVFGEQCARVPADDIFPRVILDNDAVKALRLDHRAGFLLSMIDGVSTVRDLLDVCGMPSDEGLALIHDLAARKIIALERVDGRSPR